MLKICIQWNCELPLFYNFIKALPLCLLLIAVRWVKEVPWGDSQKGESIAYSILLSPHHQIEKYFQQTGYRAEVCGKVIALQ